MQEKYKHGNPLSRYLVNGFFRCLADFAGQAVKGLPEGGTCVEVGCGEGEVLRRLESPLRGHFNRVLGYDVDSERLDYARAHTPWCEFSDRSVYDLPASAEPVGLALCCEVLEHLDQPDRGLAALAALNPRYLILSVPREPVWRALNMTRGKYWGSLGNTPGHLNHWSSRSFRRFIETRFSVIQTLHPLPWTMVLAERRAMGASASA